MYRKKKFFNRTFSQKIARMYFISNKQETNYIVNQEGPNNYSQAPLDLKTRYLNISQIDLGNASHNQSVIYVPISPTLVVVHPSIRD